MTEPKSHLWCSLPRFVWACERDFCRSEMKHIDRNRGRDTNYLPWEARNMKPTPRVYVESREVRFRTTFPNQPAGQGEAGEDRGGEGTAG